MIKELQTEVQSLQTSLNLSKAEAQRKIQEREEEICAAHRAEMEILVTNQMKAVDPRESELFKANEALILELEESLAAAKAGADRERVAMLSQISELNESSRIQITELQKKCERVESSAKSAAAEQSRICQHLEQAEGRLAASELRIIGLQADLSRAEEEKAALSAKLAAAVENHNQGQEASAKATSELEVIRKELLMAEDAAAENIRLLHEAEFELIAAFEAKQQLIKQSSDMASEHAMIQSRLQEELEALRLVSSRNEADSNERIKSLQSGLHAAELTGRQESKALRDEMDQLVRNSVSVRLMMEEQLRLAQAKLSEAQKELEDLRISASAREADLLQRLESAMADLKWEKFVSAQAAKGNVISAKGNVISSFQKQQTQAAAASKKMKGRGSHSLKEAFQSTFQSLSGLAKPRSVVVESAGSSPLSAAAGLSSAFSSALFLGGVPHPVSPIPDTPSPESLETNEDAVSNIAVEVAASLRNAWSAAEVLANTAAVKLQAQEAEAEERVAEIGKQLEALQRELEERKSMQLNQVCLLGQQYDC